MSKLARLAVIRTAVFVLILSAFCRISSVQADTTVTATEIVGVKTLDASALLSQLKKTSGAFSDETVADSVRTLYVTGFFQQVLASMVQGTRGAVLRLTVTEKPLVRKVLVKGNKEISESDLNTVLQITGRRYLDRARLGSLSRRGEAFYQGKGYYDAQISYDITTVGDGLVDVTFTVTEGARYKITEISFVGTSALDASELRSTIQTKRYKWWSSWLFGTGRLSSEMLENDQTLLRQYLLDHGFVEGQVSQPVIEKSGKGLKLQFNISEGAQYRVGEVRASGDLIDGSDAKTLAGIKTKPGKIFNASEARQDSFKITDAFTDVGYAFANVSPVTQVDPTTKLINVSFKTSKGGLVSVRRINVRGNAKTLDSVVRRELKIQEQELYSSSRIKRSDQLLERLGYFDEVSIVTEPTDVPSLVDLLVNVREGSTGSFSAGAGYSSSDGILFNARLSENNLFGTGNQLSLNADVGSERDNFVLSFNNPRVNDSFLSFGADLFATQRQFDDFDRGLTGIGLNFGYPLEEVFGASAQDMSVSLGYQYEQVDIDNIDVTASQFVKDSAGKSTVSSFTPKFIRSTINNPLNPLTGSKQTLQLELAGLGGDNKFYIFEAKNLFYKPVIEGDAGDDLVFSMRTSLSYGDSFDNGPLPLFRRFFPGGINSVRGYENRKMGPRDVNGHEFGGAKEFVNNAELIFPLVRSAGLRGVVFFDIGNAFDDNQSLSISDLRKAYGFGLRWTSPLGPIRIEIGFPMDKEEGDKAVVPNFSFGVPF